MHETYQHEIVPKTSDSAEIPSIMKHTNPQPPRPSALHTTALIPVRPSVSVIPA